MLVSRSTRFRAGLATAGLTLVAGAAALAPQARSEARHSAAVPAALELPDSVELDVAYAGIGPEGVDLVWRGLAGGPVPGRVTIRMEYAGPAAERRMPIWPVNAWLFFSADDLRSSFAAELSGSMNWLTGEMRVIGLVSDGLGVGTPVEQRMRVEQPELAGRVTVRLLRNLVVARLGGALGRDRD